MSIGALTNMIPQSQGHTQSLDGNGEYWDANILERPDNTSAGTVGGDGRPELGASGPCGNKAAAPQSLAPE